MEVSVGRSSVGSFVGIIGEDVPSRFEGIGGRNGWAASAIALGELMLSLICLLAVLAGGDVVCAGGKTLIY